MNNIEWFREAKYGMMVHFGLYSMLAGEYKGRRTPYDYGEWIQSAFAIPNREMEQLAGAFNPVYFNAEEWVKLAKECGSAAQNTRTAQRRRKWSAPVLLRHSMRWKAILQM